MKFLLASLLLLTALPGFGQNYGAAFVVPGGGGTGTVAGGSATNAQPPSTTLTNLSNNPDQTFTNSMKVPRTLFVSTNGLAVGTRERPDLPWSNIITAITAAKNLYTNSWRVHLLPGTYIVPSGTNNFQSNGVVNITHCTNVIFSGDAGAKIKIQGVGSLMWVGWVTNLEIRGIEIEGTRTNGLLAESYEAICVQGPTRNLRFADLYLHDLPNHGIGHRIVIGAGFDMVNATVENCDFYNIGTTNFTPGLLNDGTAVVMCGNNIRWSGNRFRHCLKDTETYNASDTPQVFSGYTIEGNMSEGAWANFFIQGATNISGIVMRGNIIRSYGTNAPHALNQSAVWIYAADGFDISDNLFEGCEYGLELHSGVSAKNDINIHHNIFRNIRQQPMVNFFGLTGVGPAPQRLNVEANHIITAGDSGITFCANDSRVVDNYFYNTGSNGSSAHAIYVRTAGGVVTNATNITISGNVITGPTTDGTITIDAGGAVVFDTLIYNNTIAAGLTAPALGGGVRTRGLLGEGQQQFLGGTIGQVFTLTNPTTGMGWWSNAPTATVTTNFNVIAANNLVVTNITSTSNITVRGVDGSWQIWNDSTAAYGHGADALIWTNFGTQSGALIIDQNGIDFFGNVTVHGVAFMSNIGATSITITNGARFEGAVTNLEDVFMSAQLRVGDSAFFGGGVFTTAAFVTNHLAWIYTTELIATNSTANSNLVVELNATSGKSTRELFITNNISITNFTGMTAGHQVTAHWRVMPSPINRTVVWPDAGASFGIYRWTNAASPLWTTLTNGVEYRIAFEAWYTNINMTISAYQ